MHRCMKTENLDHSLIRHFISEVGIIILIIIYTRIEIVVDFS